LLRLFQESARLMNTAIIAQSGAMYALSLSCYYHRMERLVSGSESYFFRDAGFHIVREDTFYFAPNWLGVTFLVVAVIELGEVQEGYAGIQTISTILLNRSIHLSFVEVFL